MTTRRSVLKAGALSAGAIGVSRALVPGWRPRVAFGAPGQTERDILVVVFLRGGMDGLAAVAPFGEGAPYYNKRPTQHLTEPGSGQRAALDLDGFFGLHRALAPLKEIFDEGDLGIVHATGMTEPNRSHFEAMLLMEQGSNDGAAVIGTGWLARHLRTAAWQNESPFRAVGMGVMLPDSLGGTGGALALQSIADFHLRGRSDELRRMQQSLARLYRVDAPIEPLEQQAGLVFETIDLLTDLAAQSYAPANGAHYPQSEFGQALEQVARLIKADVGLEVAAIDLGGWDTHENQGTHEGGFYYLLDALGRGLGAFYADLADRMADITVITMSEFGRTLDENASSGTDHGHGNAMFLMGGGVKGGVVHGRWPGLAPGALSGGDLAITTDYRDVLAAVLLERVRNAAAADVFPNHTIRALDVVEPRA
ncbi:MAG: DUF1501 domain-containing protein [Anaerolineae bacterium]